MNTQQIVRAVSLAASLLFSVSTLHAEEVVSSKMLVYIHPQDYTSSIKLWHYYYGYWFSQGPLVESAAKQVLGAEFGDVGMCDNNQIVANALVWLRPRMFYNPQMLTYHGEITAVAYTSGGKPIATYVGKSSKIGFLDVMPEKQVNEVYRLAMQAVATQMKADANLQAVLNNSVPANETKTPCALVTLLPAPKIQFMSF
jgi:hypothetical protein